MRAVFGASIEDGFATAATFHLLPAITTLLALFRCLVDTVFFETDSFYDLCTVVTGREAESFDHSRLRQVIAAHYDCFEGTPNSTTRAFEWLRRKDAMTDGVANVGHNPVALIWPLRRVE